MDEAILVVEWWELQELVNILKCKGKLELSLFVYATKPKKLWLLGITVFGMFSYNFPKTLYNKVNWKKYLCHIVLEDKLILVYISNKY